MSLRSILDRSRDAFFALAAQAAPTMTDETGSVMGFEHDVARGWSLFGMGGSSGHAGLRTLLFWLAMLGVMLLLAALTNPTEASFRSHLTELSFRRHLADIRSSDSQRHSQDPPAEVDCPTPFRFANHVAISLRTPSLVYRTFLFFSIALTSPLSPPAFLTISDPSTIKKGGGGNHGKEKAVVFIGFLGHWTFWGPAPLVEWFVRLLSDWHKEKGKRKERPGITDLRAVPAKEDSLPTVSVTKPRESISAESSVPITPPPSLSRRPSTSLPVIPADVPESPVVIALKHELSSSQSALADLKAILATHENATDVTLTTALDELRHRRKEDDAERQDLKTRTRSLEEQKRQAEGARKEAEKKLRTAESSRDAVNGKIQAAKADAADLREQMGASEKSVRSVQEEGARYVVETQDAIEGKKKELEEMEVQLVEMEEVNEALGKQVVAAEEKLKATSEAGASQNQANKDGSGQGQGQAGSAPGQGPQVGAGSGPGGVARASPEEEMMMMAAAYEAAAQEGYLHQNQSTWAHQAAQYMAEAGMPYLGQDYTARPHRTPSGNTQQPDVSGFEDFGPAPRDVGLPPTRPLPPPPEVSPEAEAGEEEDTVEIDPGSPNGTSFLPQGLFRSLEGDATPVELDMEDHEHDSASDSGDELWRSPYAEPAQPAESYPQPSGLKRLLPPSTTPPGTALGHRTSGIGAGNSTPALPGLPALPGSRRWFSGTSSNENVAFSFMHPVGTASNDSLLYEPSPFAPSASEKKALALKWGPLSKYRWARGGGGGAQPQTHAQAQIEGQEGIGHGLPIPRRGSADMSLPASTGTSPTARIGSAGGGWLASRFNINANANANHVASANANGNGANGDSLVDFAGTGSGALEADDEEDEGKSEKKPFRFFSLRKTPSSTS